MMHSLHSKAKSLFMNLSKLLVDEIEREPSEENFAASASSHVKADAIPTDCTQLHGDFSFMEPELQTELGLGNSLQRNLSHSKTNDTADDDDIMTQCSEDWLFS